MKKKESLESYVLKYLTIGIVTFLIILSYFWVSQDLRNFEKEKKDIRDDYLAKQKKMVKFQVDKAYSSVDYRSEQLEKRVKSSLKSDLEEFYEIIRNIYQENKNIYSKSKLKEIITASFRSVKFNNSNNSFFTVSLDGVEYLYSAKFLRDNENALTDLHRDGNFIQGDFKHIIKNGEGFFTAYCRKPGADSDKLLPIILFVKYFEPFDCYFGIGDYVNDWELDIKQEIIQRIAKIRFEVDGYIFLNTYDGYPIIQNGEIIENPTNFWDFEDPSGNKVIQMERDAAEKDQGGFIEYFWQDLSDPEPIAKVSYIRGFDKWGWMLGAGFYSDKVEHIISEEKKVIEKRIFKNLIQIGFILISLFILSMFISNRFLTRIKKNFNFFFSFFSKASNGTVKIDIEKINYLEFHQLAVAANKMVDKQISDRQKIKEEEIKFQTIIDKLGEGLLMCDLDEKFLYSNSAAEQMFGVESGGLLNHNLSEFLSPEELRKVKRESKKRKLRKSSCYELKINRLDGEIRDLIVTSTPRIDFNGQLIGSYGLFRDITEQKMNTDKLKAQSEHLELLNKILRHDLTNKLAAIKSGIHIYEDSQDKNIMKMTAAKIDSSIDLIRKMKEYENIFQPGNELMSIDLNNILEKIVSNYTVVDINISGNAQVMAYNSISSVFDNLINNAITHGKTDKIDIDIRVNKKYVKILFKDYGSGISDQIKDKVFNEGFRFGATGKSGLGLYIVNKAVESYGGIVKLTDTEPSGTTFIIKLKKVD